MNKIRDDFPENIKDFFVNLQNYLDTDLYFYGSVNRSDYVHGKSDIDVAIFTDNEYSTITKLQHFLHVKRSAGAVDRQYSCLAICPLYSTTFPPEL